MGLDEFFQDSDSRIRMFQFLQRISQKCPYKGCGDTWNYIASVFQHEIEEFDEEMKQCNLVKWEPKKTVTKQYDSAENVIKIINDMRIHLDAFGCLFVGGPVPHSPLNLDL
jgi:hypothetical protein